MQAIYINNHLSQEGETQIKRLASPLAEIGHIHYFCYGQYSTRTDDCLLLCNNNSLLQIWADRQYPMTGFTLPAGWHLWESHLPQDRIEAGNEINIGKGVYFVQRNPDSIEVFSFGTRPDNKKAYEFYLNNQNLLKRFSNFFKKETTQITANYKKSEMECDMALNNDVLSENVDPLSMHDSIKVHFLEKMSYPFNLLSAKEAPCYKLFLKGYTNCEISKVLDISPSTVDSYFSRIKKKLKCSNRIELFQKAMDAGLVDYHLEIFSEN
ncbi:MAG: hypothetical protein BGO43_06740 [Gammaproteobacteria bacterium 39-13]|nr:MAG: hypothetical protein BGO43_06740 [Gammaproteobacteria bacterium 39-13]